MQRYDVIVVGQGYADLDSNMAALWAIDQCGALLSEGSTDADKLAAAF